MSSPTPLILAKTKSRWIATPLGRMLAVAADDGLCLLEFGDRRALERELSRLRAARGSAIVPGPHPILDATARELAAWFSGTLRRFSVPTAPTGTPFQRAVWARLEAIPWADQCVKCKSRGERRR